MLMPEAASIQTSPQPRNCLAPRHPSSTPEPAHNIAGYTSWRYGNTVHIVCAWRWNYLRRSLDVGAKPRTFLSSKELMIPLGDRTQARAWFSLGNLKMLDQVFVGNYRGSGSQGIEASDPPRMTRAGRRERDLMDSL
jgi:hypothetical protein